jgi:probable rRNA maturation factor
LSLRIFYDEVNYRLKGWRNVVKVFNEVIRENSFVPGDLSFILTTDDKLKEINAEFLKHHYFTDVITFGSNEGDVLNGEIYISVDTVKSNSINYNVSLREELLRVMSHGIIHLIGYDDSTVEEKEEMRRIENLWLTRLVKEKGDV